MCWNGSYLCQLKTTYLLDALELVVYMSTQHILYIKHVIMLFVLYQFAYVDAHFGRKAQ